MSTRSSNCFRQQIDLLARDHQFSGRPKPRRTLEFEKSGEEKISRVINLQPLEANRAEIIGALVFLRSEFSSLVKLKFES